MLGQSHSVVTIKAYIRYIKQFDHDIDQLDNYKIAEKLYEMGSSRQQKKNIAKAINVYLEFRNRDFKLKLPKTDDSSDV